MVDHMLERIGDGDQVSLPNRWPHVGDQLIFANGSNLLFDPLLESFFSSDTLVYHFLLP